MSRFTYADLSGGRWISAGGACRYPLFRGTFTLPKVTKASITVAGLGIYEVYINGKSVSEDLFLPLSTDFEKREGVLYGNRPFLEELAHRVYCPQYDVTALLKEGENTVCFMMGPGWYEYHDGRTDDWRMVPSFGHIKLCYRLAYTDEQGRVAVVGSNESHRWHPGFVTKGHLLDGETHDYRGYDEGWMLPNFDDSQWQPVTVEKKPETDFYIQEAPADRVSRSLTPKLVARDGDKCIYDAGEMTTGYPILVSDAPAGTVIKVRYSELLNDQKGLDEDRIYHQYTEFTTDGTDRKLHCRFTWLCFRYFEVVGDARVESVAVIHSNVPVTSSFHCTEPVLNWLWEAFIRTQLANMHCGIPSDCPHIERRGYTGDGQLVCRAGMLQLDAKKFYEKWIYDIADCQDRKTGHVQYTAPFMPSGGGPGGWGCAIVMVPYAYYKHYGDGEIFRELFPQMLHYFEFMEAHSEDDLVTSDLPDVWCLGDWCVPAMGFNVLEEILIPEPMVNTYFYIKAMEYVLEMGQVLNLHHADELLKKRIADKKAAIVRHYFDGETGDFAKNIQGSNIMPVDLGLGDGRTYENMLAHYRSTQRLDTGIFCTDILTRMLFERGEAELAVQLLTSQQEGTFHTQMVNDATTIWEIWSGDRSRCHPMFGAVTRYLFEYILGIRQKDTSVRFEEILIAPCCMDVIPEAKGHITTEFGVVSVAYNNEHITVEVPSGVKATLILHNEETVLPIGVSTHVWRK